MRCVSTRLAAVFLTTCVVIAAACIGGNAEDDGPAPTAGGGITTAVPGLDGADAEATRDAEPTRGPADADTASATAAAWAIAVCRAVDESERQAVAELFAQLPVPPSANALAWFSAYEQKGSAMRTWVARIRAVGATAETRAFHDYLVESLTAEADLSLESARRILRGASEAEIENLEAGYRLSVLSRAVELFSALPQDAQRMLQDCGVAPRGASAAASRAGRWTSRGTSA